MTAEDTYRLNGLDVARPLPRALGLGHPLCEDGVARLRGGRVAVGNLGSHFVGFIRELQGDPDTDLVLAILVRQQAAHLHQGLQRIEGS